MLIGTGYKVLAIQGEHRYGYGHIFFDGTPNATTGMRSGDFILKKMNAPNDLLYAIIYAPNGGTPTAFGQEIGTVTCPGINNGRPIEVTNQVTDLNTPIAPIGNSGGDFAAHIHLYNFNRNPRNNDVNSSYTSALGFSNTQFRNPKNPLEFLPHDQPVYTVAINGRNLIYPGNQKSSFRVRCSMNGVTAGQTYANAVMNLDNVELYIRKDKAIKTEYKLIKGAVLESRISNGARLDTDRYPSIGFPGHNTGAHAIDIARGVRNEIDEGIGSYTRTGVSASAYTNNPWDEYYFSDFPTRIHKDDQFGGANARFASVNEEARYEDGKYQLYAKAITVRDVEYESAKTNPTSIVIDNFRPYVSKVIISSNFDIIYESSWSWDATTRSLKRTTTNNRAATSTEALQLTIITSESMKSLKVAIPSLGISAVTGSRMTDKMWVYG